MQYGTSDEAIAELKLGRWHLTPTAEDERVAWGLWTIEPEEGGYRVSAATVGEVWEFWEMCYREHLVAQQSTTLVVRMHATNESGLARDIELWASGAHADPPIDVSAALHRALKGFRGPGADWREEIKALGSLKRPDEHDLRAEVQHALTAQLQAQWESALPDGLRPARRRL